MKSKTKKLMKEILTCFAIALILTGVISAVCKGMKYYVQKYYASVKPGQIWSMKDNNPNPFETRNDIDYGVVSVSNNWVKIYRLTDYPPVQEGWIVIGRESRTRTMPVAVLKDSYVLKVQAGAVTVTNLYPRVITNAPSTPDKPSREKHI